MTKKYTIHKGNIWGANNIDEDKIFKKIGLKEGQKITLDKFYKKEDKFKKGAKKILKEKFPKKEINFDSIIYRTVHERGKVTAKQQIYCDINLVPKKRKKKFKKFTKTFKLPKELKQSFKAYQKAMQKEFNKKDRESVASKKDKNLKHYERKLTKHVKKYYDTLRKIVLNDKNEKNRIQAAHLLNWASKEKYHETSKILSRTLEKDPSYGVSNNAAIALSNIPTNKSELKPKSIYALIKKHSTICRNKAAWLLLKLLKKNKDIEIPSDVKKIIEKMAQCRQPNNFDPAQKILDIL